jgi:lactoylglutathione lyase
MARVQLALNVSDLEEAIRFYSSLFGTAPTKVLPGYANFAIVDPPLKLVLMEQPAVAETGTVGVLNHLGVEVADPGQVVTERARLVEDGHTTRDQSQVICCFAIQDKVWVEDPDGTPWEVYTVLADAPADSGRAGDGTCCADTSAACC